MSEAENPGANAPEAPAAGAEPMIPKHRFDEIVGRLRAAEQEVAIKDQLIQQHAQPRPQAPAGLTAEQLGMDSQTFEAVKTLAVEIAKTTMAPAAQQLQAQASAAFAKAEWAEFALNHGKEALAYSEKIKQQQLLHYRQTGQAMPIDTAYKLVRFDEMQSKPAPRAQAPAAPAQAAPTAPGAAQAPAAQAPEAPNPALTQMGGGPGAQQIRQASDLSADELEAHLNRQFQNGFIA